MYFITIKRMLEVCFSAHPNIQYRAIILHITEHHLHLFSVTVHAYVPSNGICRGFAFKYGKFLLPPRFLTALSVPKVPTRVQ